MSDSGSLVKMMRTSSSSKHGSGAPKREGQERRHESSAHRDARHQRSSRRYHSKDGKNVDEKRDRRKDHDSRSRSGRYDGDRNNLPREHGPRWMTLDDRDTDDYFASDENQKSGDKTSFPGTSKQRTRRFSHHSHESSRKSSNYKSSSHRSSKLSSSVTVPAHSQSGPSSTIQAPLSMILPIKSLKKDNAEFEVQEIEMSDGENGSESNDNVSSQDPADYPSDDGSKNSSISSHSSSQVGSEEEEISESEDKLPEPVEEKPESDIMQEPSSVGEKMDDSQPVGKEEETEPDWPIYDPAIQGCRSVDEFERLNKIEEGAYGVVYRAREKRTGTTVALKRVKMEKEKEGFPITSLREINTLLKAQHPNIVTVKEIVVGNNIDSIYIVMEYVEHDLKGLMSQMQRNFKMGEVKTLMLQLLAAVEFLHDHWIIHRDLKTSNLLLNHKGILKVGDFGLAREYGSPLKPYTPVVVTLWYRAPELLLQAKKYSTAIDMWSVGCIFGEFLTGKPLFAGKSEIEQLKIVYEALGSPNEILWPGYSSLPFVEKIAQLNFPTYHYNNLKNRLGQLSNLGINLITHFLSYCPERRIAASKALLHDFFTESPKPIHSSMFPTWPAKSEAMDRAYKSKSPKPPSGGKLFSKQLAGDDDEKMIGPRPAEQPKSSGFRLRF